MSKNYMYHLGGSGGGSESIQKNIVKDNLIQHSEIMDFPELITILDDRGFEHSIYYDERYPSGSALMFRVNNGFISCDIPLYEYMIGQSDRLDADRYYTLSYHYQTEMSDLLNMDISLNIPNVISDTEEGSGPIRRRVIVFKIDAGQHLFDTRLHVEISTKNPYVAITMFLSSLKLEYGDVVTNWVPIKKVENVIRITKPHHAVITLTNVQPNSDVVVIHTSDVQELRRFEVIHVGETWEDTTVAPVVEGGMEFYTSVSYNDGNRLDLYDEGSDLFYTDETVHVTIIGNNLKVEE
jgi:hypothetical protein